MSHCARIAGLIAYRHNLPRLARGQSAKFRRHSTGEGTWGWCKSNLSVWHAVDISMYARIPPPPFQAWLNSSNSLFEGGGMPISTNRSLWPVTGGSVGIQPGWFSGHSSAFFYINLGDGTTPENYSSPMLPVFQIKGPNNNLYNGSICLTQVPLPKGYKAVIGRNATIQVIETAQHGAALYNVRNRSTMIYDHY